MWRDSRNKVVVHHSGKYAVVVPFLDWDKHPYSWSWLKTGPKHALSLTW